MRQIWEDFWRSAGDAGHLAMTPFRLVAEAFGYTPPDMQIYALLVVVFMVGLTAPEAYGDFVLARRYARATGKVAKIDTSGDGPDTPVIDFKDASGQAWTFNSPLPCNAVTRQVGAHVALIYDPLHPRRAREEGRALMKAFRKVAWYGIVVFLLVMICWPGMIEWEAGG